MIHRCYKTTGLVFFLCLYSSTILLSQKINREKLVQRHNVIVTKADSLSSLTVGNGKFAFTVDVTGLQTFPKEYEKGVCLGTQSEWGWHSFIDTVGYKREEAYKNFHVNGRDIPYSVQVNSPERNKAAANWFRQNPHRLQLGNISFELIKRDGTLAQLSDIQNIHQELILWTGEIKSHFTLENIPVDVSTYCYADEDAVSIQVNSPLILQERLKIRLVFPYPTGDWADAATKWTDTNKHLSAILESSTHGASLIHKLDQTAYYVWADWTGHNSISNIKDHHFVITPDKTQTIFEFSALFMTSQPPISARLLHPPNFHDAKNSSEKTWAFFWNSGGAIDFSGSTDPRAFELERRIILSQYLLRAQEAGSYPSQETGLTYNSWYGKPHLEMVWWHAAHWAMWGRTELLQNIMDWYSIVAPKAKAIAQRQGFDGVRWQKMTDNTGNETPSSIGALLIWEQPHFIYFAELCYRSKKYDTTILNKYKDLVFATADFMASFPYYDSATHRYILGKGVIPAQERFKPEETFNPTYELVYWHWALDMAQQWRERLHLPRNKKWDDVLAKLSALPIQTDKYLFTESATDSYTNPEFKTDHPAVLGAFGMMPATGQVDTAILHNTFDWIWNNWNWEKTWGWDFPLVAMTTIRMGQPEKTIDVLLMDIHTNRYLVNGHNYQDERLRIYLPGNGGLLAAAAMMCAGYDGCTMSEPGVPKNKQWKVRWEGLMRIP